MNQSKNSDSMEIFKSAPIPQAVLKNTIPAMAAMMMVLIYNLADTFFIGQTNDALMVAAVSLVTPAFLLFMALGTVFGIGGTSVISRAMGEGRKEYAKKVCSFCMWSCVAVGIIMAVIIFVFMDPILTILGASSDTYAYAKEYLSIVTIAGPFVLISNCYANIIRTEGKAGMAMIGQLGGNLLNVILDPVLILGLHWNVAGAAALGDVLMSVSNILLNGQMAKYGDMAVAGIGVAMKVTMITGMLCIGFGQGIQPLLGYCIGARNQKRFREALRFSVIFGFALSTIMTLFCYLFTSQIIGAFLSEPEAYSYGMEFTRILLTTSFLFGIFYVLSNALQAILGIDGLLWAQPVADILSVLLVIVLYKYTVGKILKKCA